MPSAVHRIHLRTAWAPRTETPNEKPSPPDAASASPDKRLRYARRFGRPTGLTDSDEVWIVVELVANAAFGQDSVQAWLNGQPLERQPHEDPGGESAERRWLVTRLLEPRNEIWLDLSSTASLANYDGRNLPGVRDIRLEIVSPGVD